MKYILQYMCFPCVLIGSLSACGAAGQDGSSPPEYSTTAHALTVDGVVGSMHEFPAKSIQAIPGTARCALDLINGHRVNAGIDVPVGDTLLARGWVSSSKGVAPIRFTVVFAGYGTYGFSAVAGLSRPDVAKVLANTQAASSGFEVTLNSSSLPADTYRVEFLMDVDGRQELCDSRKFVNVLPSARS